MGARVDAGPKFGAGASPVHLNRGGLAAPVVVDADMALLRSPTHEAAPAGTAEWMPVAAPIA